MALTSWLLIFSLALSPDFVKQSPPIKHEKCDLARAILFVIREHLSKLTSAIVITEQSAKPESAYVHNFLLDFILNHIEDKIAVQLYIGDYEDEPSSFFFFIVDSEEAFRMVCRKFSVNSQERRYFFLIVLTEFTMDFFNIIENMFKLCHKFHVVNVSLIVDHPELGVCIFTYKLFTENDCRVVQPILHFRFNEGLGKLKNVFPKKLGNFYKCPLRVTGRIVEPLLIFTGNSSAPMQTGNWSNLSGIDGMIMNMLALTLNFTIQLVSFPVERTYADNGTAHGCYRELLDDRADVAIGGFSGSDPNRWLVSPSVLYNSSPFVFVVRGGRLLGSMARLGRSFNCRVWIMLGITMVCAVIIIQILRFMRFLVREFVFGKRNDAPTINLMAVSLGYPINRVPRRNFARYIFTLWLFFTLVIRNAYQGSLYDAFRMHRFARTPSGMGDLLKWNFDFLTSIETSLMNLAPKNRTTRVDMGYLKRFKLMEHTKHKYATIVQREVYMYYMGTKAWFGSDLLMINEVIFMNQQVALFPKNSLFLPTFNENLKALSYSGFTRYISTFFTKESLWLQKASDRVQPKPLSNERLKAMYEICAVMLVIAIMVFGLEILSAYNRKLRWLFTLIN